MANKKSTRKYFFTVEGETELWYLQWLEKLINSTEEAKYKVSFDCKVQKNPLKRAKSLNVTSKVEIYHLSDYESDDPVHAQQFIETMDNLKKAREIGKQIVYRFGYSNLTFDLWIVLHRRDCNSSMIHRSKYLEPINRTYGEHFESMAEYKHEDNFKRCLSKLDLSKGYRYYKENPSLLIWEPIEKILRDCELC